jgi:D-alanyl-D-alanine carboxypeptidase (penicillin-binding protein 5/6)
MLHCLSRPFLSFLLILCLNLTAAGTLHAFSTPAKQAYLMDMQTGTALFTKQAQTRMGPSSMSKMMTVYLLLEAVRDGKISLQDTLPVSEKAWRKGGSKMFVEVGKQVKVEDLLRGIAIQSGNDACIVVAEGLAGSEDAFASLMNRKAAALGLKNSHFTNSTGWPDPEHYMTAQDLAILAAALIRDFPNHYFYWAERDFTYNGIRQDNRNSLLGTLGIDGLKTGHTEAAGYGITVSGVQEGRRLIAVVNGLDSKRGRITEARRLMAYGFSNFENIPLFKAGQSPVKASTWLAKERELPLVLKENIILSLPVGSVKKLTIEAQLQEPLPADTPEGAEVGSLMISGPGVEGSLRYPLYTAAALTPVPALQRIFPVLKYRLTGIY